MRAEANIVARCGFCNMLYPENYKYVLWGYP